MSKECLKSKQISIQVMHDYTQKNTPDKKTDKIILELRPKIITETIFTNSNLTFNI